MERERDHALVGLGGIRCNVVVVVVVDSTNWTITEPSNWEGGGKQDILIHLLSSKWAA
jgi:hypothetical protein